MECNQCSIYAKRGKAVSYTDSTIKEVSREISVPCASLRAYIQPLLRFRAVVQPDKLLFNHNISMDLMRIEGIPALHIVDTHTGLQNATVLRVKKAEDIRLALIECCDTVNTGYTSIISLAQEPGFNVQNFGNLLPHSESNYCSRVHNVITLFRVARNVMNGLRKQFCILKERYTKAEPEAILLYAVKSLNDSMVARGLITSLLVFGTFARFPVIARNTSGKKGELE